VIYHVVRRDTEILGSEPEIDVSETAQKAPPIWCQAERNECDGKRSA